MKFLLVVLLARAASICAALRDPPPLRHYTRGNATLRPPDTAQPLRLLGKNCLGRRIAIAAVAPIVLAALASPIAYAEDPELPALKQQVEKLQKQLNDLEARDIDKAHPASTASSSPSFDAGPVKLTLSGFVELMGISRSRNEADDWASNFNTGIPFPNSHNYDLSEFHLTERQSRIAALAQGPTDSHYATEAYVETDFGGSTTNGNNNQSSSFAPRVRHFYADYQNIPHGWSVLFGQTWSLVTAHKTGMMPRQENIPLTIDGQYVPGFDWLRVPQVRLVKSFGNTLSLGISAENPAAQVAAGTTAPSTANLNGNSFYNTVGAGNAFASTTNITTDYVPDIVAKVAFDPGWGHYEVLGLTRWFRSRYTVVGEQSNQITHGYAVGGSLLLPLVAKRMDLELRFLDGTGVGRYGSVGEPDVTVNPVNGSLTPLRGYHVLGGLVLRPAPAWTLFAYGGIEHVDAHSYDVSSGTNTPVFYGYGYGNPLFSNAGCETEGSSACAANTSSIKAGVIGGWWKFYEGRLGNMQLGATDTYIRREIFPGVGGDPSTNINIALVSFRYYPYQK